MDHVIGPAPGVGFAIDVEGILFAKRAPIRPGAIDRRLWEGESGSATAAHLNNVEMAERTAAKETIFRIEQPAQD